MISRSTRYFLNIMLPSASWRRSADAISQQFSMRLHWSLKTQFSKATVLLQILGLYPCCLFLGLTRLYELSRQDFVQFLLGNCVSSETAYLPYHTVLRQFSSVRHTYCRPWVRDVSRPFQATVTSTILTSLSRNGIIPNLDQQWAGFIGPASQMH